MDIFVHNSQYQLNDKDGSVIYVSTSNGSRYNPLHPGGAMSVGKSVGLCVWKDLDYI